MMHLITHWPLVSSCHSHVFLYNLCFSTFIYKIASTWLRLPQISCFRLRHFCLSAEYSGSQLLVATELQVVGLVPCSMAPKFTPKEKFPRDHPSLRTALSPNPKPLFNKTMLSALPLSEDSFDTYTKHPHRWHTTRFSSCIERLLNHSPLRNS